MSADAEDDIVACGDALRTVAGWLGVADVDSVLEKEGLDVEYEAGRQQGLGLGAKYLPHNKALALTSGVQQRLSSKLKRTAERRAAEQGAASGEAHQHSSRSGFQHASFQQRQGKLARQDRAEDQQRHHHHQQQQQQQQQPAGGGDPEDSNGEEEGRGGAFGKGKAASQRPATYSRSDLLKASEAMAGKKRKRRKGGGPGGGPGAAG